MKIKDIAKLIEDKFPLEFAMDGDNVGLLVGDQNTEVTKILVCCDVDEFVADEAKSIGANLIISHHPLMFHSINRLIESNPEQRTVRKLVQSDIALYTAHTNLDVGRGGINDYMASLMGLKNTDVIEVVCQSDGGHHGYGRFKKLNEPVTLRQMLDKCKQVFDLDGCRYVGDFDDIITTVAINTGGGAGIMDLCFDLKADLLVTGDVKYNPARDAYERGMDVIDIAHYDTEKITMDFFKEFFAKEAPEVDVVKSKANIRIYKVYA